MCGIAGIFRRDGGPVDPAALERMKRATRHRGPDDAGVWCQRNVGLVHNRLSILDLSANGHQPMVDERTGNIIVFNGEVYNFQEIRPELEALGHVFHSKSDTEVVLRAYAQWGEACVERFRGMFAFAIFDVKKDELFVVRDRLGIKPLYYYADGHQFIFASETKAIVLVEGVPRRINQAALPEYIAFRYVSDGRTLFQDIHELKPGHWLRVSRGGIQIRQYWDIPFHPEEERDDARWIDALNEELLRSVRYRLIADVPVGCALSGGVDSSLVTAMACEVAASSMKTFTIGFNGSNDERCFAKQVSDALGVENYTEVLDAGSFYEHVPRLTWHMDEPMNHPNSVAMWQLAKLARPKVTVLLSGEGGDEVWGGYDRFRGALRFRHLAQSIPASRVLAGIAAGFARGRYGRIARELHRDDDGRLIWSSAYLPSQYLDGLFGPGAVERAEQQRREILTKAPTDDLVNRHIYYELKTYLVSILMRNDKMTMAVGLENRVPLLDHKVIELAGRLPTRLKVDRTQGKKALFRLVEKRFGRALFNRPKVGFALPPAYFQGEGLARIHEIVGSKSFRERGWMDSKGVDVVMKSHAAGSEHAPEAAWVFAALEIWARTFIDRVGEIAA
jgi:asparagine synthase (glutamine-hydrolysing)